jgi:hypothetical protein
MGLVLLRKMMRFILWLILGLGAGGILGAQGTDAEWEDLDKLLEDPFYTPKSSDTAASLPSQATATDLLAEDTLYEKPPPPPPLRLIDSPRYPRLTMDPQINRRIRTSHPFQVQIVRPKLQNSKGHPLPHGFDTYYLYIVKAEEVRIEGKVIRSNGLPIYLAIVSPAKSPHPPTNTRPKGFKNSSKKPKTPCATPKPITSFTAPSKAPEALARLSSSFF